MGLLSQLFVPAKDAQGKAALMSGSPTSPLRHIPSFNDFVGDAIAPEAEAESARYTEQSSDDNDTPKGGPASPAVKPDVWRSVFDPGSNPNMHLVGRQMFDTVADRKRAPSTWDYILQAEKARASFGALDQGGKGYINEGDLRAAFDHKYDTGRLMDQADANRDGRISREEFDAIANIANNSA